MRIFRAFCVLLAGVLLLGVTSCRRSTSDFENRPLEKRPHTETVKPEDRGDAFRP